MMRIFTVFTLLFLLSTNAFSTKHLSGSEADKEVRGSTEVWYKTDALTPSFIRFNSEVNLDETGALGWLKQEFGYSGGLSFAEHRRVESGSGMSHVFFNLVYENILIEFGQIALHVRDGRVESISGVILPEVEVLNNVGLSSGQALDRALSTVNASRYLWEDGEAENFLKDQTQDPQASYYPEGEVVIFPIGANFITPEFRYAYKFNIRSIEPVMAEDVYVDAVNGEVVYQNSRMHESDSVGTAYTGYSGLRPIITKKKGTKFSLQEDGRGIYTWDVHTTTNIASRVEFLNDDNIWQYQQGDLDQFALDAHWGGEQAYDFYFNTFNRDGMDGAGMDLNIYVHWGEGFSNSFYNNDGIHLGDNLGVPYNTIDIIGHEMTHGVVSHSAGLIYEGESGAINESFCDIFGNCIEHYGKPNYFSWGIGEDRGSVLRDMQAPKLKGQPNTYGGENWYDGPLDNGGIHINSGVMNYWFYLLTEGGNGINDKGKSYDVQGVGIHTAAWIAYETLTAYLTPTSDFEDVRFYSTVAVLDSFQRCDVQHGTVVNAWHAVGLGDRFVDHAQAAFNADRQEFCGAPFTVNFTQSSINALDYTWNFGDGAESTLENPSHTYNEPGTYHVSLTVEGGDLCGLDVLTRNEFIVALMPEAPEAQFTDREIEKGDSLKLSASSQEGVIHWYSDSETKNLVNVGVDYVTPPLFADTKYFLKTLQGDCESNETEIITVSVFENPIPDYGKYQFYSNENELTAYFIRYFFKQHTRIKYGLYSINGQQIIEFTKEYGQTNKPIEENVNDLFSLSGRQTGVYFITIQGGGIEKTEKIVNKGGSN